MTADVRVLPDAAALFAAAAGEFARLAGEAVSARASFSVALSGGSTPKGLYALLASDRALRTAVPWERTEIFFGDERHVPPENPDSNARMAMETLLSRVPLPADHIHRIQGEDPDAGRAAAAYESDIRRSFGLSASALPRLDLALLGLGPDGHTASLFPDTPVLDERHRICVAVRVEKLQTDRISLTVPVFNAAWTVAFLVSGADKAEVLAAVLEGPREPRRLPAQLIRPSSGRLVFFVDEAAAARLSRRS